MIYRLDALIIRYANKTKLTPGQQLLGCVLPLHKRRHSASGLCGMQDTRTDVESIVRILANFHLGMDGECIAVQACNDIFRRQGGDECVI